MVLITLPSLVVGRSSGILSSCDLTPQPNWPNGKFGRNFTTGGLSSGIMIWTKAPTPASFYTLRSGDDAKPANDPKSYTPNTWNEIHLRVTDLKRRYIGLVLYATSGMNGTKQNTVGEWSWPKGAPFQTPQSCGGSVVTHIDADLKPLHTRFYWKPTVGTGDVTFRILIKQGEQNKGNFFWAEKQLKLTEGVAPVEYVLPPSNNTSPDFEPEPLSGPIVSQVVVGGSGMSCADVCNKNTPATPFCDHDAIKNINTVAALQSAARGIQTCRLPILAGCPYAGGARVTNDGYCSYRSNDTTTCPPAFQNISEPEPNLCFTASATVASPICVCTNSKLAQPPNPYSSNSASRRHGSLSSILMMALALVASMWSGRENRFLTLVVIALVAFAQPALGHNYIKSVHRANEAAVSSPCQARVGLQPHVQIIANQQFEVEWACGHGDMTAGPFYFAVVRESDLMELKRDNITAILADYVKLAPTNASNIPVGWDKQHIRGKSEMDNPVYWVDPAGLPVTSPLYIQRDPVYRAVAHPSQYKDNSTYLQLQFKKEYNQNDKRISYVSAKYPWLEHVSIFYNNLKEHTYYNNQADIARFTVPAYHGSGNYVLFFRWQGYTDCVDVNVVAGSKPVVNRYGSVPSTTAPPSVIKQDHCEYTYVGASATQCRKLSKDLDASLCIQDCIKRGMSGCSGVQVVRAQNPSGALPYTPNIPYVTYQTPNDTLTDLKIYQPCSELSVHDRITGGCVKAPPSTCDPAKLNLTASDYVCYGLLPRRNQDNQVEEDYRTTDEPEDPVWYSTCFQMDPQRNFMNVPPIDYKISDWSNGDTCLKCDFYSQLSKVNMTSAPDWTTGLMKSSVCVDCSMANSNAPFTVVKQQLSGPNLAVAGHGAAAANAELNNSSDSWSDNKTHLGLLIGGVLLIGLILIGFGGWISWRYAHKRNRSAATIGKMARETDTNHIDITLTSNPAVGQSSY